MARDFIRRWPNVLFATVVFWSVGGGTFAQAQTGELPPTRPPELEFIFDSPIAGYRISGIWFPVQPEAGSDISGPAIFNLTNLSSGQVIQLSDNWMSLLDEEALANLGDGPDRLELLLAKAPLHLDYTEDDRARQKACRRSSDTCLQLGVIPIDVQDMNFSGAPELVVRHRGRGQRGSDTYSVYSFDPEVNSSLPDTVEVLSPPYDGLQSPVFGRINSLSVINLTKRQIELMNSNGACNSSYETYSADAAPAFSLTAYRVGHTDDAGDCIVDDYRVETDIDGVQKYVPISSQ